MQLPDPAGAHDHAGLGQRLRERRRERGWSLERLASASGVSRAAISRIERDEATPGTTNLSRLAEALETTFAELMSVPQDEEVVILKAAMQPVMVDADTGFERRCIAPILPSRGLDWVHNMLPAGETTGTFVPHRTGVEEYIYVLSGTLEAFLGDSSHLLKSGDALYFRAHVPHRFSARGKTACKYLLVIDSRR